MFVSRSGRNVQAGQRVKVYRNLHNQMFSIMDPKTGRVVGYAPTIHLENCSFVVQPAGRARVLREKRKNVHAYAIGHIIGFNLPDHFYKFKRGHYDPYTMETFQDELGNPLFKCFEIVLTDGKLYFL